MSDTVQTNQDWQERVEQRINDLEAENEKLKASLETQRESGLPNVSRRQALGGLLGGGALLGAAGTASADSWEEDEEAEEADEAHDHSGDVLGQGTPVEAIRTGELNNVEIVRPGDDIQAAIDRVYTEATEPDVKFASSGTVRFLPDRSDDRVVYEFPDPPYTVRKGVTLDMRGISARFVTDADAMFDLRGSTNVLGHGAHFDEGRPPKFTGALWYISGDKENRASVNTPANVFGFPSLGSHVTYEGESATTALLEQTLGDERSGSDASIGGCYLELGLDNTQNIVKFHSTHDQGWINHNTVIAKGATAYGNAVEYEVDGGVTHGNYVWIDHLQVKPGMERILYCHGDEAQGIARNYLAGNFVDFRYLENTIAEWASGTGHTNPILTTQDNLGFASNSDTKVHAIDNSGTYGNYVGHVYKSGQKPFDLSKRNGFFDGERALDDGTNTDHRGVECTWDNENVAWIRPDGTAFEGERDWFHPDPTLTYPIPKQSLNVDGDISGLSDIPGLSVDEDFSVHLRDPTLSGTVWLTWDQSNLYLAADFTDDEHSQPETGAAVTWSGDVLELGVAKGEPSDGNQVTRITAALTPNGPQVIKGTFPGDWYVGKLDVPAEIVRNEETNHTRYEVAVPWGTLPIDATADVMSLSLAIRDVDATKSSLESGKTGYREWGGGMLTGIDLTQFNRAELVGN